MMLSPPPALIRRRHVPVHSNLGHIPPVCHPCSSFAVQEGKQPAEAGVGPSQSLAANAPSFSQTEA